jgi:hypothetical protein
MIDNKGFAIDEKRLYSAKKGAGSALNTPTPGAGGFRASPPINVRTHFPMEDPQQSPNRWGSSIGSRHFSFSGIQFEKME